MIHELKISPEYFMDVVSGVKPFEIRKNDRDFKVGDCVKLNEYDAENGYTGESMTFEITYVMTDAEYVKEGFAVLGIRRCSPFRRIVEAMQNQQEVATLGIGRYFNSVSYTVNSDTITEHIPPAENVDPETGEMIGEESGYMQETL